MARILFAEDDDQMRGFLQRGLHRAGYAVDALGDGAAALAMAEKINYDLLLTDIVMPELDGIELARRVVGDAAGDQGHVHHRVRRGRRCTTDR